MKNIQVYDQGFGVMLNIDDFIRYEIREDSYEIAHMLLGIFDLINKDKGRDKNDRYWYTEETNEFEFWFDEKLHVTFTKNEAHSFIKECIEYYKEWIDECTSEDDGIKEPAMYLYKIMKMKFTSFKELFK